MIFLVQRTAPVCALVFVLLTSASCASTPGAKPDDMSAEKHEQAVDEHEAEATAHEAQFDPEAEAPLILAPGTVDEYGTITTSVYNPTEQHLQHAKAHRQHAADHAAATKELEAFEDQQCGRFPVEVRRTCPLMANVVAMDDIDHGVRIRFAQGANLDAISAHVQCHLAFARKVARKGMDHCPLYLPGVQATADSAAGTIDLVVDDEKLLGPLRKRARTHMPIGE